MSGCLKQNLVYPVLFEVQGIFCRVDFLKNVVTNISIYGKIDTTDLFPF